MIKILFYLLPLLAVYLPDLWVRYIFKKNNKIFDDMPFTGTELGHKILKEENLEKITFLFFSFFIFRFVMSHMRLLMRSI